MQTITRQGLQAPEDAPLILCTAEEPFNSTRLETVSNVNSPDETSKHLLHSGSGYNNRNVGSISPNKHCVFVLSCKGEPLTPTTPSKARKLMRGRQAKPIWNKFNQFGIQMIVEVGNKHPETVLGVDNGTKFEGYSVVTGKENNLSVMWLLPDKKKIVRKLDERRILRRARRQRNCRRRECKFNNRARKGFIAPSQKVIVLSRLKAMREFFKCYPIDIVAIEDVKFNHRDKKWGKNFSTVEIGKTFLYNWIKPRATVMLFSGIETQCWREYFGYRKTRKKNVETFNSHCSDALAIAGSIHNTKRIPIGIFLCVDDTYRPCRRKLHKTQPQKGGKRRKESQGNFQSIRKGTISNFGLVGGGSKNTLYIYPSDKPIQKKNRFGRTMKKVEWLSHHFKIKNIGNEER